MGIAACGFATQAVFDIWQARDERPLIREAASGEIRVVERMMYTSRKMERG
jgi:hypothetical protein